MKSVKENHFLAKVIPSGSREYVLLHRIERWNENKRDHRGEYKSPIKTKQVEREFCKHIDEKLFCLLESVGYKPEKIVKEFKIRNYCRLDYLVKTENKFVIIEVKRSYPSKTKGNSDVNFIAGIGQLLAYKTMLSVVFDVSLAKIDLVLLIDVDSPMALSVINDNRLEIKVCVVGEEKGKFYNEITREN